jgi:hypothetical protein
MYGWRNWTALRESFKFRIVFAALAKFRVHIYFVGFEASLSINTQCVMLSAISTSI